MTESAADIFVAGMVHHGWKVEPLGASDVLTQTNSMDSVVAVSATHDKAPVLVDAEASQWAEKNLEKVFEEHKLLYHSLIIVCGDNMQIGGTWAVGNSHKPKGPAKVPDDAVSVADELTAEAEKLKLGY